MSDIDKLPPHSEKAEQAALGTVLLRAEDAWKVLNELQSELPHGANTFYDLRHRTIYETMIDMWNQRKMIDVITLMAALKDRGQLTGVGGVQYLAALADMCSGISVLNYTYILAEKAIQRAIIQTSYDAIEKAKICEDVAELTQWFASKAVGLSTSRANDGILSMAERVSIAIERMDRIHSGVQEPGGLPSGIAELDSMTGGFMDSEYIVIAGRPSTGKSALAVNIADYLAVDLGFPVGVLSLEMTGDQLTNRLISARTGIDSFRLQRRKLTDDEIQIVTGTVGKISKAPLHIYDSSKRDLATVQSTARKMKVDHSIRLLVIDYLQRIVIGSKKGLSPNEEIGFISAEIKSLAAELAIPIVCLSQLNRDSDKGKPRAPRLSDLRGSGGIEQDADTVLLMWRPKEDEEKGDMVPVELIVGKQRNGDTGTVDLQFFKKLTQFRSPPPVTQEDVPPFMR